jgi:uncharacterized protein
MKQILIISDTHGFLPAAIEKYAKNADEIWHAGDVGSIEIYDRLCSMSDVKAVFGNIDGHQIRRTLPETISFKMEGLKVLMTHIGGYPGRYFKGIPELIEMHKPDIFICGHSHILKVMRDKKYGLLHINPGACGITGFHKMLTAIRAKIENGKIIALDVIEFGSRNEGYSQ